jgi:WD40 repeat protein
MKFGIIFIVFTLFYLPNFAQKEPLFVSNLHGGNIKKALFNNQNEVIISAGLDGKIYTTKNDSTYEVIDSIVYASAPVSDLSLSRDGKYLLTAHQDGKINRYFVEKLDESFFPITLDTTFSLVQGRQIRKVLYGIGLRTFFFTTNENKLYTYSFSNKKLMTLDTKEPVNAFNTSIDQMRMFVAGSRTPTITEYDLMGKEIRTFNGHQDIVNEIIVTTDRKYMISVSSDKTIKIWNLQNGKLEQTLEGHDWRITGLVIDARNEYMASSCLDGNVFVWDFKTKTIRDTFHIGHVRVMGVAFNPDATEIVVTFLQDKQPNGGFKIFKTSVTPPPPRKSVGRKNSESSSTSISKSTKSKSQKTKPEKKKHNEKTILKSDELEIKIEE